MRQHVEQAGAHLAQVHRQTGRCQRHGREDDPLKIPKWVHTWESSADRLAGRDVGSGQSGGELAPGALQPARRAGAGLRPDGPGQGAVSGYGVIVRHALKNALIPVVTLIGLQIGAVFVGALVRDDLLWPGIGRLAVDCIGGRDYPVVQAIVLVSALSFMVTTLLIDILYS